MRQIYYYDTKLSKSEPERKFTSLRKDKHQRHKSLKRNSAEIKFLSDIPFKLTNPILLFNCFCNSQMSALYIN